MALHCTNTQVLYEKCIFKACVNKVLANYTF